MSDETVNMEGAVCAPPLPHNEQIVMGHGAGGRMTHQLIQKAFLPAFDNSALRAGDDAAVLEPAAGCAAFDQHGRACGLAFIFPRRRHRSSGSVRHGQ